MSVPGAVAPVTIDRRQLVDGGLVRNLPVDIARQMGADVIIAVNLGTPLLKPDEITSVFSVTMQMINILTEQNVSRSLLELGPKDILIVPELGDFSCPSLIITSRQDHVVPPENSDVLADKVGGPVERIWLDRSYHVATPDYEKDVIEAAVVDFAKRVTS